MALIDYEDARCGVENLSYSPNEVQEWHGRMHLQQPCAIKSAGKHPRNSNWQDTPVWDDVQLSTLLDEDGIF